ncbi:hypothetical protein [Nonomuraea wenchangensis]|uniref:hypothetical protein n=1 Tax=Nonomuraea wenchangensis TaxID=568860 RepID=UPI003787968F
MPFHEFRVHHQDHVVGRHELHRARGEGTQSFDVLAAHQRAQLVEVQQLEFGEFLPAREAGRHRGGEGEEAQVREPGRYRAAECEGP